MGGAIAGGFVGIGVLIGIVFFLKRGKSQKYANDSRETIDTQPTEIFVPSLWIQMIDMLNKSNYYQTFLEHENH